MTPAPTLFETLGGEPALRAIIDAFIDRVVDDLMIGFLFRGVDVPRLKQREYEFAARHLGALVPYTGRPLPEAHAPHRIMGGQFVRRLKILDEVLDEFGAPPQVRAHWVDHTERLRGAITADPAGSCDPARPTHPAPVGRALPTLPRESS